MGIVSLVGLSGSGKSTVAGLLAERLDWTPVDLDAQVERDAGCSIAVLFERDGEAAFRRRESDALARALGGDDRVIATGGGAPCQPGAMETLLHAGRVIWLKAPVPTLLDRLSRCADRPLLSGRSGARAALERQLEDREAFYRRADVTVETGGMSPETVAEEIAAHLLGEGEAP